MTTQPKMSSNVSRELKNKSWNMKRIKFENLNEAMQLLKGDESPISLHEINKDHSFPDMLAAGR